MSINTEDRAFLAKYVYNPQTEGKNDIYYNGHQYEVSKIIDDPKTGYYGAVYQDKASGELIVVHRGSEDKEDFKTDLNMVANQFNPQLEKATELVEWAIKKAKDESQGNKTITISQTGHSLGGSLAQLCAQRYHLLTDTFNAYGVVGVKGIDGKPVTQEANASVTNHISALDIVASGNDHFGKNKFYLSAVDEKVLLANDRLSFAPLMVKGIFKATLVNQGVKAHGINNFVGDSSLLNDPLAQNRYNRSIKEVNEYQQTINSARSTIYSLSNIGEHKPASPYDHLPAPYISPEFKQMFNFGVSEDISKDPEPGLLGATWDKQNSVYLQIEAVIPDLPSVRQRAGAILSLLERNPSNLETFINQFNPEEASRILTYAALKTIEEKESSLNEVFYSKEKNVLGIFSEFKGFTVPTEKVAQQSIPDITQNHNLNMAELEQQRQDREQQRALQQEQQSNIKFPSIPGGIT